MAELVRVTTPTDGKAILDVVFVHGLGGDKRETWQSDKDAESFWPAWLSEDIPGIAVHTLGYDASPSVWLGHAMPLVDRAHHVLALLEAEQLGERPLIFICHSLGGLLVKQMLRGGDTQGLPAWQKIARQTRAVVFLATPHAGARLADYLNLLGKLARTTAAIDDLRANEPHLRELATWYSNNAPRLGIQTRAYFETRDTKGLRVVDETSANPGISGVVPIGVDADHLEICKPADREAFIYKSVRGFIASLANAEMNSSSPLLISTVPRSEVGAPLRYFLSYRRRADMDARLAGYLAQGLRNAGCEVFVDIDMPVGIDWSEEIARRIAWADFLVVLLSEESIASEMVQGEVRRAHQAGKAGQPSKILPVRVAYQGELGYELDSYIGKLQYVLWQGEKDNAATLRKLLDAPTGLRESPPLAPAETTATPPSRPQPKADMRLLRESLDTPGCRLDIETPFYIRREADQRTETLAYSVKRHSVFIKGPNQSGKSSLLLRYLAQSQQAGKKVAIIDLLGFGDVKRLSFPAFARQFAQVLAGKLRLRHIELPEFQQALDLTYFVEDHIFPRVEGNLILAIDELDRAIGSPWQEDFFSTLRVWDSNGSDFTAKQTWGRLGLALAIATDPRMLIESNYASPFNTADPITLGAFPRAALDEFNERYARILSPGELDRRYALLHGQPYLTPLAFYRLACEEAPDFTRLVADAADPHGPFGDHLRAMFDRLHNAGLLQALGELIRTGTAPNRNLFYRLEAAGLVREEQGRAVAANEVYQRFFKAAL